MGSGEFRTADGIRAIYTVIKGTGSIIFSVKGTRSKHKGSLLVLGGKMSEREVNEALLGMSRCHPS